MDLLKFAGSAKKLRNRNREFLNRLKRRPPKNLDVLFASAHNEVFDATDCLACANCCKTTSPIFYQRDIEKAAGAVDLTPGAFIDRFLRVDEDGDHVLISAPCPFLQQDNRCAIYAARPAACREYPHTNRKRMYQVLDLTFRNTQVCPAVLEIVRRLENAVR